MAREIKDLHPDLQVLLKKLIEECKKQGLKIGIGECARSVTEQDALYAKGRTEAGNIVTNAKGSTYSSMHQFYVAFDVYRNDGKGAYNDSDGFFAKVGKIGQKLGLEWGGVWKFKDQPHFQLPNWGSTTSKLKAMYGTPEKFRASWDKKSTTTAKTILTTISEDSKTSDILWLQTQLNKVMKTVKGYTPIKVDGKYGNGTAKAVLKYWDLLGWNSDNKSDGTKVGKKTIDALKEGRIK